MANVTITLGPATIVVDAEDAKKAYDKARALVKKARGKAIVKPNPTELELYGDKK